MISAEFLITVWLFALGACVSVVLLVHRRRRRRLLSALGGGMLALVLVLTAVADSVNAYYAYLPTVSDALQAMTGDQQWVRSSKLNHIAASTAQRARQNGLVVRMGMPADPADGFPATNNVAYLPPQYFTEPAARFPVIYLFHGSPGQPSDWFHAGQAQQTGRLIAGRGRPAIIVAPQMSRNWTDDPECVDGTREKVESHLLNAVIPRIDSTLRTRPDRAHRTFAGMSAGGFCALNLGLRNRAEASTIIDMSGDTEPTHSGGAGVLFGKDPVQRSQSVLANSPGRYAASITRTPAVRIWLDSGSSDATIVRQMTALRLELIHRGFPVVWRVRPGGHTYWVWKSAMNEAVPWAVDVRAAYASRGHPDRFARQTSRTERRSTPGGVRLPSCPHHSAQVSSRVLTSGAKLGYFPIPGSTSARSAVWAQPRTSLSRRCTSSTIARPGSGPGTT